MGQITRSVDVFLSFAAHILCREGVGLKGPNAELDSPLSDAFKVLQSPRNMHGDTIESTTHESGFVNSRSILSA